MKRQTLPILVIMCLCLMTIAMDTFAQNKTVPENTQTLTLSFAPLVKQVSPAVVNIYTKRVVTQRVNPFMNDPLFAPFFGDLGGRGLTRQQVESSLGSGVILDENGLVVTNAHVVKGATEVVAVLNDGREFDATLSLADDRSDLAILRLQTKGEKLPFATLKPSEGLEVGDIVIAIGNPFGVGQTVTSGIVSALARSTLNINDFNFFIQTDAAINPGNSGGPLVDSTGGVVGINTAIYSRGGGSLGIGFAVPSEMVATVIAAEKSGNHTTTSITRTWMGIYGQQVTSDIAQSLGLKRPTGVLINKIHPASPLLSSGMRVGDVVTAINGRQIRDAAELKFRLATVPLGDSVTLDVLRAGKALSFTVKSIAPPNTPPRDEVILSGPSIFRGLKLSNINPAVQAELSLEHASEGVVVLGMADQTQISRLFRPGDVILSINGQAVSNVKGLQDTLKSAAQNMQGLAIVFDRNGEKSQIILR
jgi:Do/DeqQ family serine protease